MLKVLLSFIFLVSASSAQAKLGSTGKFAKIKLLEGTAIQNQKVSVLVYPQRFTGDIPLDTIVKGKFDNQVVTLERFGYSLWRFKTPVLSEIKSYVFIADVYIEDKKQADITRTEIQTLSEEIAQLAYQIQYEADPVVLQQLMNERDQKIEDKTELSTLIDQLRTFVGTESFSFVPANTQNN